MDNEKNILTKYKRRIPLIKKCLEAIKNGNKKNPSSYMKYCRFICKTYGVNRISNFFDGDLKFLSKIYFKFFSFHRKYSLVKEEEKEFKMAPLDTLNGLLLEPINPSHTISQKYYFIDGERVELLNTKDSRFSFGE